MADNNDTEKDLDLKVSSLLELIGTRIVKIINDERITIVDVDNFIGEMRIEIRKILIEDVMPNFKNIDENFEKIREHLEKRFNKVDTKLESVDQKLEKLDEILDRLPPKPPAQ